jgi:hypothetical protein
MITIWKPSNNKQISSEISEKNILNYKRRSKLVSKTYCHETNKNIMTFKNEIDTLKNCYNFMYDLKNTLSDYISFVRERKFTKAETEKLIKILELSKSEIISSYNVYEKCIKKSKYTFKEKREKNKMIRMINDVSNVVVILSNDIKKYF